MPQVPGQFTLHLPVGQPSLPNGNGAVNGTAGAVNRGPVAYAQMQQPQYQSVANQNMNQRLPGQQPLQQQYQMQQQPLPQQQPQYQFAAHQSANQRLPGQQQQQPRQQSLQLQQQQQQQQRLQQQPQYQLMASPMPAQGSNGQQRQQNQQRRPQIQQQQLLQLQQPLQVQQSPQIQQPLQQQQRLQQQRLQQQQQQQQQHLARAMANGNGQSQHSLQTQMVNTTSSPMAQPHLGTTTNYQSSSQLSYGTPIQSSQYNIPNNINMGAGTQSPQIIVSPQNIVPPQNIVSTQQVRTTGQPQMHQMANLSPDAQRKIIAMHQRQMQQNSMLRQLAHQQAAQQQQASHLNSPYMVAPSTPIAGNVAPNAQQSLAKTSRVISPNQKNKARSVNSPHQKMGVASPQAQGKKRPASGSLNENGTSGKKKQAVERCSTPQTSSALEQLRAMQAQGPYQTMTARQEAETQAKLRKEQEEKTARQRQYLERYQRESNLRQESERLHAEQVAKKHAEQEAKKQAQQEAKKHAELLKQQAEEKAKLVRQQEEAAKLRHQQEQAALAQKQREAQLAKEREEAEEQKRLLALSLERERAQAAIESLKRDPTALYRHYNAYLKIFPLYEGERRNQYLSCLLANQDVPLDTDSDTAIAITFAKEHWDWYMVYPKDIPKAFAEATKNRKDGGK